METGGEKRKAQDPIRLDPNKYPKLAHKFPNLVWKQRPETETTPIGPEWKHGGGSNDQGGQQGSDGRKGGSSELGRSGFVESEQRGSAPPFRMEKIMQFALRGRSDPAGCNSKISKDFF